MCSEKTIWIDWGRVKTPATILLHSVAWLSWWHCFTIEKVKGTINAKTENLSLVKILLVMSVSFADFPDLLLGQIVSRTRNEGKSL